MINVEESLMGARNVFVEYPKMIQRLEGELKKLEQESQDYLHLIEMTSFSAFQGFKYAKELQNVRRQRREIKDDLEQLYVIKELNSVAVKPSEKNVNKAIGEIRKIKRNQETRSYRMRIREDLQPVIDGVNKCQQSPSQVIQDEYQSVETSQESLQV